MAVASQPFWFRWNDGHKGRRHAPDYFLRLRDGRAVVVDGRAADRIEIRDAEAFMAAARACASVGWEYRRVGAVPAVLAANRRRLAGYRHPRCVRPEPGLAREVLRRAAAGDGWSGGGGRSRGGVADAVSPDVVRPVDCGPEHHGA
ncbi:TnsA-like heteromeric transposase endonuclease subunit [Nocardia panacis]|uniref:TnsA-like heteromeric transposase endonuclease subunit n=1 Tax=Nocardia panacis TaxID=2340916 RepID=UPI001EF1562E|nr:TnsA-like heteromeric transposase endonuclease subunit [Nocardia panacis]